MRGVIMAIGAALWASAAKAELQFCNHTDEPRTVAIAYKGGEAWAAEGWWTIAPEACKTLVGGDLAQRYYYYTESAPSGFVGGEYSFCTAADTFEVSGADGDCAALGGSATNFAQIDTGADAKSFTFNLTAAAAPKDEAPALPAAASTDSFTQGAQGEPFSITARLQGCGDIDGFDGCSAYAEGWRWAFAAGAGSNPDALAAMASLPAGTALLISGDILGYGDITVDALASRIALAPPSPQDATVALMQGDWVSDEDAQVSLAIHGMEEVESYGDEVMATSMLHFAETCPDGSGAGPVLIKKPIDGGEEAGLCYTLDSVDTGHMVLMYLGAGNILSFSRR